MNKLFKRKERINMKRLNKIINKSESNQRKLTLKDEIPYYLFVDKSVSKDSICEKLIKIDDIRFLQALKTIIDKVTV